MKTTRSLPFGVALEAENRLKRATIEDEKRLPCFAAPLRQPVGLGRAAQYAAAPQSSGSQSVAHRQYHPLTYIWQLDAKVYGYVFLLSLLTLMLPVHLTKGFYEDFFNRPIGSRLDSVIVIAAERSAGSSNEVVKNKKKKKRRRKMVIGNGKHHEAGRGQAAGNGVRGESGGWGIGFSLQQLLLAAVALVLIPSIFFAFHNLSSTPTALQSASPSSNPRAFSRSRIPVSSELHFSVQLSPNYENINGTEFVWQIPSQNSDLKQLKGIVFFAHGCYGRSTFFWDHHPNCGNCTGMPEERLLTLHALSRGYAVIAVTSLNDCWKASVDIPRVVKVLRTWTAEHKLEHLPVAALGASSGGFFVSILATRFKFQSLVIEISYGKFEAMNIGPSYPPTLFVYMPKDERLAAQIKHSMEVLRSKGVETDELLCSEMKVTPHFFSDRIPRITDDVSEKLVHLFAENGLLNRTRYMKVDGRASRWVGLVRKSNLIPVPLRLKLQRHVEEEMNLAYAFHEMTSVPAKAIFRWFESHSNSSALVNSS
ncbi:hypothetical protein R1sor_014999 [Riccia sorocarpa]|uniref:Uncharacterized protein n=1 Tax=Riccia sorocarpa TaxID=122646 RepID=A0ABD3HE80_9MARC